MVFTAVLTAIAVIAAMVTVPWAKAGAAEPTDFVPNTTLGAENAKIGGDHSWGQLVWAGVPPEGARNPHKNNDVGWGWCIDYTVADPMLKKGSYKKSTAGAIRFDDPKFQNAAIGIAMKLRDATAAGDKKLANRYSVYLAALVSDASGRAAAIKFIHANDGGNVSGLARPLHGFDGNSEDFTANTGLRILKDNAQTLDQQFEADPSVTIPEQPADAFITVVGPNGITTHNSGGGQRVVPIDQPGLP
ncbi:adhesin, partial [Corynebacterium sp. c25Ua_47]